MIVKAYSIVQFGIQIKNGILINANARVKSIGLAKKIIVVILAYVFERIISI